MALPGRSRQARHACRARVLPLRLGSRWAVPLVAIHGNFPRDARFAMLRAGSRTRVWAAGGEPSARGRGGGLGLPAKSPRAACATSAVGRGAGAWGPQGEQARRNPAARAGARRGAAEISGRPPPPPVGQRRFWREPLLSLLPIFPFLLLLLVLPFPLLCPALVDVFGGTASGWVMSAGLPIRVPSAFLPLHPQTIRFTTICRGYVR